jgi:hypothetical protein
MGKITSTVLAKGVSLKTESSRIDQSTNDQLTDFPTTKGFDKPLASLESLLQYPRCD